MAKDPAFLFYPNDWIGGTMGMSFEEKGAYMELLMMQFNRGHMTYDMMAHTVGRVLDKVLDKFIKDAEGLYYNVRLEEEKLKRKRFVDSRLNNKKGSNQYSQKEGHMEGHMTSDMENEDSSLDSIESLSNNNQPNSLTKQKKNKKNGNGFVNFNSQGYSALIEVINSANEELRVSRENDLPSED